MREILYNLFIMPVEMVVEFIFYFMNKIFVDEPGVSIIFVSLIINLLILPLYKRADAMQEREREKVKSMDRWNKHIRKTFKGDERYMMQNAYYRIEGYKPFYAITGSLSLLFQVPFFIAGYHFLSNLEALKGMRFSIISDLGAPDGILSIGGHAINILPIVMTIVNILSGIIYTKGFKLKDKIQLYGMAILFLIILYKSPSGLVLYWTCNNLFSLGKNIFFKLVKNKRLGLNILCSEAGKLLFVWLAASHRLAYRRQYIVFGGIMILSYVPFLLSYLDKNKPELMVKLNRMFTAKTENKKVYNRVFWLGALLNTVILGVLVPSMLISSSPIDFGTYVKTGPLSLVVTTASLYTGLFIVWFGIFYAISNISLKRIFAFGMWICGVCCLINFYFFYGEFGIMDASLKFDEAPQTNDISKLINLAILLPIVIALVFIVKKWPKIATGVMSILILMTAILSGVNIYKTNKNLIEEGYYEAKKDTLILPTLPLSKTGKNVVVFMLDRAVSEYVPYVFKEKPEIAEQFEDFVYYPNTITFGGCTNYATPALFGGYEYTPAEINKRTDETLADKHNEALLVVPTAFAAEGYDVSVVNPQYANYKEYPDVSIFDEYDKISGYTTLGKFDHYYNIEGELEKQKKHMVFYSLFRTAPILLQNFIYDEGNYLGAPAEEGVDTYCAEGYAILEHLDEYVYVDTNSSGTLNVITNLLTHEPTWLRTPEYEIGKWTEIFPLSEERLAEYCIDGKVLSFPTPEAVQHYHVNVAAYKLLGQFFDYLKKEGIYDNTRIIIVSDHGWPVYQTEGVVIDEDTCIETFNPVLMVKDFADSDELVLGNVWLLEEANLNVCDAFMTNADVATLCVQGVLENPVNRFTDNVINSDAKYDFPLMITTSRNSSVTYNNGNVYDTSDYPWMTFNGGYVRDVNNWTVLYGE